MKRALTIILTLVITASLLILPASAAEDVTVLVNGTEITFDQPPVIVSGRTLVPARAVFEFLGASVYWDETDSGGYVSVVTGNRSIVLEVNKEKSIDYMIIDNVYKLALDVPSTITGGRTLVPLRAIGDALSGEVDWDGDTRTAIVNYTMPEEAKLSSETHTANLGLTYSNAKAECENAYSFNTLSSMPKYDAGVKYYEGISKEKQEKYICKAGEAPVNEAYPIYASVDDIIIPYDEYKFYLSMYSDVQGNITEEYKEYAKKELINTNITVNHAIKSGVIADKKLISATDYYLYNICYGMDYKVYASMTGISPEAVYNIAEKYAFRNTLYNQATENGEIDVSDSAINQKFEEMFYKAKHILFKTVDDEMKPLADSEIKKQKKLAEDTLKKLKNGADFDKLMAELTEDGESSLNGYVFTDGQMVSSFENAVKALKADEISDIVESEYGYHIIKRLGLSAEEESETVAYYKNEIINHIGIAFFNSSTPVWADNMNIIIY